MIRLPALFGTPFLLLSLVIAAPVRASDALHAPMIDVDQARAEFMSDNARPAFTIRHIYVIGAIDTLKAVIKTSSMRSLKGEYHRYKPVLDSVWAVPIDSARSEVFIAVHLEGKGLPLPKDSVLGSVRLTASAAVWNGEEWLATTSQPFSVRVINWPIPRARIDSEEMTVVRSTKAAEPNHAVINGIVIRIPRSSDSVRGLPELRTFARHDVEVTYEAGSLVTTDTALDARRSVQFKHTMQDDGTVVITAVLTGRPLPIAKRNDEFRFAMLVRARLRHGQALGRPITETIDVSVPRRIVQTVPVGSPTHGLRQADQ
jgi:hypothetical protein